MSPRDSKAIVFPVDILDAYKALNAKLEQIPSTSHFSSKYKAKITADIRNSFPKEYAKNLPEGTDTQLEAMQSSILDVSNYNYIDFVQNIFIVSRVRSASRQEAANG